MHQFVSLEAVRRKIEAWRLYKHHRPHGSLGHLTPCEIVAHRQERGLPEGREL